MNAWVTHLHTRVQTGYTALMLACENKREAAMVEIIRVTKLAGALDLQVAFEARLRACVVRGVWSRSRGRVGGGKAGREGRGRALTCGCA